MCHMLFRDKGNPLNEVQVAHVVAGMTLNLYHMTFKLQSAVC